MDSFLDMVRKYTEITELTAEIIRSFVEKIEVMKPEKEPGTRTKKQTIVIHWNFIGAVEIPDTKEKTAKPEQCLIMPLFFSGINSLSEVPKATPVLYLLLMSISLIS